jgi:hypothetical protein
MDSCFKYLEEEKCPFRSQEVSDAFRYWHAVTHKPIENARLYEYKQQNELLVQRATRYVRDVVMKSDAIYCDQFVHALVHHAHTFQHLSIEKHSANQFGCMFSYLKRETNMEITFSQVNEQTKNIEVSNKYVMAVEFVPYIEAIFALSNLNTILQQIVLKAANKENCVPEEDPYFSPLLLTLTSATARICYFINYLKRRCKPMRVVMSGGGGE